MKVLEILTEASSLSSLGVDKDVIKMAHADLGVTHNEEFQPASSKAEIQSKLKDGHTVVVVGPDKTAVIAFDRSRNIVINRNDHIAYVVAVSGERHTSRKSSLKDALAVAGTGKYYVSKKPHYTMVTPYSRKKSREEYSGNENVSTVRAEIIKLYGKLIKSEAKKAQTIVKRAYMKAAEKRAPSYQLNHLQKSLEALQDIEKNGFPPNVWDSFTDWYSTYLRSIDREATGFGSIPANKATMRKIVLEPLFKQKFTKFVLDKIKEITQNALD